MAAISRAALAPANLAFQWQRELKEKFDEKFLVLRGGDIRDQFGINQWLEHPSVITSLDLAKRTTDLAQYMDSDDTLSEISSAAPNW